MGKKTIQFLLYILLSNSVGATTTVDGIDARIVDGVNAPVQHFPYFIWPNLRTTRSFKLCGASLIFRDVAISAGHCRTAFERNDVYSGGTALYGSDAIERNFVERVLVHPWFQRWNLRHDIMLIKLRDPSNLPLIEWNTNPNVPAPGERLVAAGFGSERAGGPQSSALEQADLFYIPPYLCRQHWQGFLDDQMQLCASGGSSGVCTGDSGGPLVSDNGRVLIGISSFVAGSGCAQGVPDGFTRVSSYDRWIREGICQLTDFPPEQCADILRARSIALPVVGGLFSQVQTVLLAILGKIPNFLQL